MTNGHFHYIYIYDKDTCLRRVDERADDPQGAGVEEEVDLVGLVAAHPGGLGYVEWMILLITAVGPSGPRQAGMGAAWACGCGMIVAV